MARIGRHVQQFKAKVDIDDEDGDKLDNTLIFMVYYTRTWANLDNYELTRPGINPGTIVLKAKHLATEPTKSSM